MRPSDTVQQLYSNNLPLSVIDQLDTFLLVLNTDGTLLAANRAAKKLLGGDVTVGSPVWSLKGWCNADLTERTWRQACLGAMQGTGVTFVDEMNLPHHKKTKIHFSLAPLTDESQHIVLLLAEGKGLPSLTASGAAQGVAMNASHLPPAYPPIIKTSIAEERVNNIVGAETTLASLSSLSSSSSNEWLLTSEDRFRLMVESIEDYAMFMVDLEGFITSWNRGAERLTGYSDTEAIGRHFSMLYPRDTLDKDHAVHELMMAEQHGRYEEEGVRVRKNGTHYHAQIIVWRIDNNEGKTVGYAKITRDITALKQAQQREAQLLESENRFRLMVESIDDYAMFMVDTKGFIISWNRGAERLTGYSESEAIGRPFSILYPKDQLSVDHALYELNMARINGRHEEEGHRVRKDGSIYHAQIIVWPVADKSGEIVSFAKITRDITQRKAAERALKDSEARFRTMTDAMPQMVWSALPDGKQDYINRQWFRFTGANEHGHDPHGWLSLVHAEDAPVVGEAWENSLASGGDFEAQFRLRHVTGSYRWALARALPVRDEQGIITRWMGTLTDIHEQKRAETALQESARRKDEYLAMLAHELRNPLAPIRNSTELLRRLDPTDELAAGGLEVIDRQVAHMTRLIDDLLDVARISRGKIELRLESVELGELARQTTNDFRAAYDKKRVNLLLDVPLQPLWLLADPTRIAQALGNLLHNALKFTDPGGEVCMSLEQEIHNGKPFGTVTVKDTGIGIDPALLDHLFEPFVQGDQDLARSKGGLGLGLALIKGFASLHGGHVQARSAGLGSGAEFVFRVPLAASVMPDRRAGIKPSASAPLKIVLIDDNNDMADTLAALLSLDGHAVSCAYDGESGLQLIKSVQPHLVLCDIGLPGEQDGYAVARGVRDDMSIKKLFMVALSGYGQEKDKRRAFECGFDDHLLKPVDFSDLTAAIKSAERLRAAEQIGIGSA